MGKNVLLGFAFAFFSAVSFAQVTVVTGRVTDALTNEPIPFANVSFKGTTIGTLTDMDGNYSLQSPKATDTLEARIIGYLPVRLPVKKDKRQVVNFVLSVNKVELPEVVIKPGENPAHALLRKIIEHKPENNKEGLDYYEYEAYNKLEFDITNISPDMKKKKIFKPFAFVFDNIDSTSTNEKPFLPMFITESMSNVYFRKNPAGKKEVIKATKTSGIENLSISQFLGDMYQNTNVYENFIPIFGKSFVSPISSFGLLYYRYYLVDSAFMGDKWCYKMTFKPRRKQELTFSGEMWVHDTTFAVKKISMNIAPDANINFVNDIAMVKEFDRVKSQHWMLSKDILVVDFVSKDKNKGLGFIGRKTASYRKIEVNSPRPADFYGGTQNVVVEEHASEKSSQYWTESRHDSLGSREKKIYAMVDTIKSLPIYQTYVDVITTVVSGYKKVGSVDVGPYFTLYSFNPVEGHKFRLGFRTNNEFNKRLGFDGYLAYGTRDKKFKYGAGMDYLLSEKKRQLFRAEYRSDVEQLANTKNAFQENNILVSFLRRVPSYKLTHVEEKRVSYEIEWFSGFSNKIGFSYATFTPLGRLDYSYYPSSENHGDIRNRINTSEVSLSTRFAFHERVILGKNKVRRVRLGSKFPILQLQLVLGLKNVFGSDFNYQKVIFRMTHKVMFAPFGYTRYTLESGKIFGSVPFPLLEVHKGNEAYAFDNAAFNLMNYYEFVSDIFASAFVAHHFDGFFFDRVPLFRRLKWREVATGRVLVGSLGEDNRRILVHPEAFRNLTHPYTEVGAGIENIFKILRVDAIWRLSYTDRPGITKFGIRANLQIAF